MQFIAALFGIKKHTIRFYNFWFMGCKIKFWVIPAVGDKYSNGFCRCYADITLIYGNDLSFLFILLQVVACCHYANLALP